MAWWYAEEGGSGFDRGTNLGDQSGGPVWRSRCSREWFPTRVVLNGSGFRDSNETSRENLPGVLGGRVSWGKHRAGGIESGPSSALSIRFWALLRIVASVSGFGQQRFRIGAPDHGIGSPLPMTASDNGLGRWLRVVAGVVDAAGRDERHP